MNRPRAMVMLTRSVPSTTRPARASIRVAARAFARAGEDVLDGCFIFDQCELATEAGEEEPLVEVGADEVNRVRVCEAGWGAGEGDFAVESGLAGDVDLVDGKAARERGGEGFVMWFVAFAGGGGGGGWIKKNFFGGI